MASTGNKFVITPLHGKYPIYKHHALGATPLWLGAIELLRMGIFSGYFRLAAAMFEGSNVQWRLGKIAFHIADKLRRQLTRQG